MAKIEVDEATYNALNHISTTVENIMKNPKTRTPFMQITKAANPNLAIPEVDAAAPAVAAIQQINKKLDDFVAAQAEKEAKAAEQRALDTFQAKWDAQAEELRRAGWRQNGIDAIKSFAEANHISDLAIAAKAYEYDNPMPQPERSGAAGWNLFMPKEAEDNYIEELMKSGGDNEALLDQEIRKTLADVRAA